MITVCWAIGALVCEAALIRPALGGWAGPDLLVLVLLARARGGTPVRAALAGWWVGFARDLVATTRPGTYALAYLVVGLVAAELDQVVRVSRALFAAALALLVHSLVVAVAWAVESGAGPQLGVAFSTALATALCAWVLGLAGTSSGRP